MHVHTCACTCTDMCGNQVHIYVCMYVCIPTVEAIEVLGPKWNKHTCMCVHVHVQTCAAIKYIVCTYVYLQLKGESECFVLRFHGR